MKKFFIAVAALGFLAACSGNKSQQNVPVEVEEESVTVAEAIPVEAAVPIIPSMKEKPAKPVNMRDSLKVDAKKGAVVQKKFKGKAVNKKATASATASQKAPEVDYDLTMYYQQDDTDNGVYEMDAVYMTEDSGQNKTYTSTGKRHIKKGTPSDASATVYALVPSDGSEVLYFLVSGNTLIMLDEQLQPMTGDISYVLTEVQ